MLQCIPFASTLLKKKTKKSNKINKFLILLKNGRKFVIEYKNAVSTNTYSTDRYLVSVQETHQFVNKTH